MACKGYRSNASQLSERSQSETCHGGIKRDATPSPASAGLRSDNVPIFTALHGMQTRSSDGNSVCSSVYLSVCPSVTRVNCDKTVERSVQIFIPYERSFSYSFLEKRMVGGRRAPLRKIFSQLAPVRAKLQIFNRYSSVAPQPKHPAKKVQLTLIGNPLRAFQ